MKLSTRGRYALRVMIDLADNVSEDESTHLVKLKDVAERQEISKDYMVHLVTALKTAGLVRSSSGKNGGYALSLPPDQIKVLDIVEAAIGSINILDCLKDETLCHRMKECRSRKVWNVVNEKIKEMLASITLEQITETDCDLNKLFLDESNLEAMGSPAVCGAQK
ncbi:MAG: Rrf2 family transcriptional regulator [bacterium]